MVNKALTNLKRRITKEIKQGYKGMDYTFYAHDMTSEERREIIDYVNETYKNIILWIEDEMNTHGDGMSFSLTKVEIK